MRIALAQINPTVGDIAGNCRKIIDFIERAQAPGRTARRLPGAGGHRISAEGSAAQAAVHRRQPARGADDRARSVRGIDVIVGYAERNEQPVGRPLHNAVAVLRDGKIVSRHFKTLLPTYDVFDESRYFEPGPANETENLVASATARSRSGLSICEDLWNDEQLIARRLYHQNPIADLNAAGAELLVNASASPFVVGKHEFRLELFGAQVKRFGKPLVYVNQVGGNDELVFDGNSVVFDAQGNVIAQAKDFEEDLADRRRLHVHGRPPVHCRTACRADAHAHRNGIESIYNALVLGLRDYVRKCGFKSGGAGTIRRHRLGAHRRARRRCAGQGQSRRRRDAQPLQLRSFRHRCQAAGGESRHRVPHRPDQADSRRLRADARARRSPAREPRRRPKRISRPASAARC